MFRYINIYPDPIGAGGADGMTLACGAGV